MEIRFPGIDWFCDNCGTHLNNQPNFDDRKYIWKCKKCGYKNSISAANIRYTDPILHKIIGFLLGFIRSLLVYSLIIVFTAEVFFNLPPFLISRYRLLFLCMILYPVTMILSMIFERGIMKYGIHEPLGKWIILSIPFYFFTDLIRPFHEILSFPFSLINLIHLKAKGISYKKYFHRKCLYMISYLALLLLVFILLYKSGLLGLLQR